MRFLRELAVTLLRGNPLEREGANVTGSELVAMGWGAPNSGTGLHISPEGAMRIGAAYRGVQIIAGAIAGLPLKAYRTRDKAEFLGSVLDRNEPYTKYELLEMTVAHMVLWGNAYWYKVRDARGTITALIPLHPSRLSVDVIDEQAIGFDFVYTIDGKGPFTRYEITHIPALSLDGIEGIGPITHARETFAIAVAGERAAAKLYGGGMMMSGIITTDQALNQESADNLKARWRAKMGGVDNAHEVAVMDRGAKFQQLTMPPADAQFLDSRKFQVTEIARLLGLPGWTLNDQEKTTSWGTGMEQQFTTMVVLNFRNYMHRIEQRATRDLLPRTAYSEFNAEGLLRGDSTARAAFYSSGIVNGWMTPNEVRARENLPPVPWGDEPYLPHNTPAESQAGGDEPRPTEEDDNDDDSD